MTLRSDLDRQLRDLAEEVEEIEQTVNVLERDRVDLSGIVKSLSDLTALVQQIANELLPSPPTTAVITQGEPPMPLTGTIKGLAAGATDTFFVTPTDASGNASPLPAGSPVPTITADDATVTVTTAADGLSASVTTASSAAVGSSFNLNWAASFTRADGTVSNITGTANVPILGGAGGTGEPTGGVFSQGAPAV